MSDFVVWYDPQAFKWYLERGDEIVELTPMVCDYIRDIKEEVYRLNKEVEMLESTNQQLLNLLAEAFFDWSEA